MALPSSNSCVRVSVIFIGTSRLRNLESHSFHLAACVLVSVTSHPGNVASAAAMFHVFFGLTIV